MKKILMLVTAFASAAALSAQDAVPSGVQTLSSPDGDLSLKFTLTERGEPCYWLDYKDKNAVLPSTMGFELKGKQPVLEFGEEIERGSVGEPVSLYDGFRLESVSRDSHDGTWTPVWGEESQRARIQV